MTLIFSNGITRQQQFEYAYIFGAVCPAKDQAVAVIYAMLAHFREISAHVPKGRHGVLVLDQTAWHTTNKVQVFGYIFIITACSISRAKSW